MQNARVVIIESDPDVRAAVVDSIEYAGHEVTRQCATVEQSLNTLDRIHQRLVGCDVLLLANLNENDRSATDTKRILERKAKLEIPGFVIGLGFLPMHCYDITEGIDADITKIAADRSSMDVVKDTIAQL